MPESIAQVSAGDGAAPALQALEDFGATVVTDAIDRDVLRAVNAELDPFVEQADPARSFLNPALSGFFGDKTRHVAGVAGKSPTFASDVLCHPFFLSVADAILGPSCAEYQLNIAHLLDRGPGAERQMLHRDELVWVHVPRPHPELQMAMIIALEDFTDENGSTRVVPGSHRWPLDRQPDDSEIATAVMPAGSVVLYLGSTLHGGGANTSKHLRRRGLHLSYMLGWLRPEENNVLSTPREVARKMPRRAQELIGYSAHDALADGGGYLGTVDLRAPVDLLEEGNL